VESSSAGAGAAARWLAHHKLHPPALKRWYVEVSLALDDAPPPPVFDDRIDTRFHIDIYSEEWGIFFCHRGNASWIRVTDIAFVHGRDDFDLLSRVVDLQRIGSVLRELERTHQLAFQRQHALVRTNLSSGELSIRRWVESL
jgi:hypothetical protein